MGFAQRVVLPFVFSSTMALYLKTIIIEMRNSTNIRNSGSSPFEIIVELLNSIIIVLSIGLYRILVLCR